MLTRKEIEERLAELERIAGATDWKLKHVEDEREALETAKQLAEWLEQVRKYGVLPGVPGVRAEDWLEGKDVLA